MNAADRAEARDYWTRPSAVKAAKVLDTIGGYLAGAVLMFGVMFAGSLNF